MKIKTRYYLELLMSATIKLIGSTKTKITKNKNDKNVPNLEIREVILVPCTIVNNNYQQKSRASYIFLPIKLFSKLLHISPKNVIFLKKNFDSELSYNEAWFTE